MREKIIFGEIKKRKFTSSDIVLAALSWRRECTGDQLNAG